MPKGGNQVSVEICVLEAVRRCEHPILGDQRASAEELPVLEDGDDKRMLISCRLLSANDPGAYLVIATHEHASD
jgi:hypothetical protein